MYQTKKIFVNNYASEYEHANSFFYIHLTSLNSEVTYITDFKGMPTHLGLFFA